MDWASGGRVPVASWSSTRQTIVLPIPRLFLTAMSSARGQRSGEHGTIAGSGAYRPSNHWVDSALMPVQKRYHVMCKSGSLEL
jgi:hypothetical protein